MNTKGKISEEDYAYALEQKMFHEQEADKWAKITRAYQYALQHEIVLDAERRNKKELNPTGGIPINNNQ